jgi:curli biogenesis system outer membrane secretion channel CsgG
MRSGKLYTRENVLLTSSPSLRKGGALTKARLNVLSWLGLLTLTRTSVSPESTLLTFACEMAILEFGIDIIETVQVQKWGQTKILAMESVSTLYFLMYTWELSDL